MDLIKTSQLDKLSGSIDSNDFFLLVDSGSHTTFKATMARFASWAASYGTASHVDYADDAGLANTASYANQVTLAFTASHLFYTASNPTNTGTASHALNAGLVETASYFDLSGATVLSTTYAKSASWVSESISASYVPGSGVSGSVVSSSYVISASYSVTASYAITTSYSKTTDHAGTASHVLFAATTSLGEPFSVYGPFVADPTPATPTREWGQYDEEKRAVSFILEGQSDLIIKCFVNCSYQESANALPYIYFGTKMIQEGLDDPITAGLVNSDYDSIVVAGFRNVEFGGRTDDTIVIEFTKLNVSAGQYAVYVAPFDTSRHIGVYEYAVSASQAQVADYDAFYADEDGAIPDNRCRIYKLSNSVQVLVYSKKNVIQGVYPDSGGGEPETAVWREWSLNYRVTSNTITNGIFEYNYTYDSALGNGTALWVGPMGSPGQVINIRKCLPSDHTLTSVLNGPIGTITSGPTLTTVPCVGS